MKANTLKKSFLSGVTVGLTENNSNYNIVNKAEKGVLTLDVEIVSFMPYTDRKNTEVMTKGSGELHISVQLRDGKTGSLVHIYEATIAVGDDYQPNTDMARLKGADRSFHVLGQKLRAKLDNVNG